MKPVVVIISDIEFDKIISLHGEKNFMNFEFVLKWVEQKTIIMIDVKTGLFEK